MVAPPTPDPDASPAVVRSWFTTLLCNLHAVPEDDAREIASKWKFGRGSELKYYDVGTFREIFGPEAGTLLFGHARKELGSNLKGPSGGAGKTSTAVSERPKTDIFGLTPGLSLIYLMLGLSILFGFSAFTEVNPERAAIMTAFGVLSMFCFLLVYFFFYFL